MRSYTPHPHKHTTNCIVEETRRVYCLSERKLMVGQKSAVEIAISKRFVYVEKKRLCVLSSEKQKDQVRSKNFKTFFFVVALSPGLRPVAR